MQYYDVQCGSMIHCHVRYVYQHRLMIPNSGEAACNVYFITNCKLNRLPWVHLEIH